MATSTIEKITPADIGAMSLSEVRYVENVSYNVVTPGYSDSGERFFKAALKYIAEHYNNAGTFVGIMEPNSRGPFIGHIYDVNDRDSSTGLPRYSTFIFHGLHNCIEAFGTDNYSFYYRIYSHSGDIISLANGGTGVSATDTADLRSKLGIPARFGDGSAFHFTSQGQTWTAPGDGVATMRVAWDTSGSAGYVYLFNSTNESYAAQIVVGSAGGLSEASAFPVKSGHQYTIIRYAHAEYMDIMFYQFV